jgi:hypothetical protein
MGNSEEPDPNEQPGPEPEIGKFVKIVRHGERFWVEVIGSSDADHLVGRVNNHLVVASYRFGETIPFGKAEIIEVLEDE